MHNTTTHKAPNTRRGTPRQPYAALRPRFARHRHASFGSSKDSNYSYDAELRLTQAQTDTGGLFGSASETYTLDPLANRTRHRSKTGDRPRLMTNATAGSTIEFADDARQREAKGKT